MLHAEGKLFHGLEMYKWLSILGVATFTLNILLIAHNMWLLNDVTDLQAENLNLSTVSIFYHPQTRIVPSTTRGHQNSRTTWRLCIAYFQYSVRNRVQKPFYGTGRTNTFYHTRTYIHTYIHCEQRKLKFCVKCFVLKSKITV